METRQTVEKVASAVFNINGGGLHENSAQGRSTINRNLVWQIQAQTEAVSSKPSSISHAAFGLL